MEVVHSQPQDEQRELEILDDVSFKLSLKHAGLDSAAC
jgi:hypothetical protein